MVAVPIRAVAPCPDATLRGTRLRGRGGRVTDPSSLSYRPLPRRALLRRRRRRSLAVGLRSSAKRAVLAAMLEPALCSSARRRSTAFVKVPRT